MLAAPTSTDASYSALDPADVAVTVTDDDAAGITVSETTLTVAEAAGTGTFTVVLQSQPTANVTIAVSSDATGNATVSPASLTFTSGNWATAQTVTVTGVDDDIATGDRSANIVLAAPTSTDALLGPRPC